MRKVFTDFNAINGDGEVLVLREEFGGEESFDQRVLVADHEGNQSEGVVTRIKGGLVYVKLDWNTWLPG
jgi:hypothetical protein